MSFTLQLHIMCRTMYTQIFLFLYTPTQILNTTIQTQTGRSYSGIHKLMRHIRVEGKGRYENSFRPYCSQHKGSFVFKHLCKYCIVLNTKGILFSSIYVNVVLFSAQRSFVLKHLCKYCIALDTQSLLF